MTVPNTRGLFHLGLYSLRLNDVERITLIHSESNVAYFHDLAYLHRCGHLIGCAISGDFTR